MFGSTLNVTAAAFQVEKLRPIQQNLQFLRTKTRIHTKHFHKSAVFQELVFSEEELASC